MFVSTRKHIAICSIFLSCLLGGAPGCAPKVRFQGWVPGKLDIGPAQKLVLVESAGRRAAHNVVKDEIRRQTQIAQYFAAEDQSDAVSIQLDTTNAVLDGEIDEYAVHDLFVRTDILEWGSHQELRQRRVRDRRGRYRNETYPVYVGKVLLQITVMSGSGRILLHRADYEGVFENESATGRLLVDGSLLGTQNKRNESIHLAASIAVQKFLAELTPTSVSHEIRLDDSVNAHKPVFELAKKGHYEKAARALERIRKHDPKSAVVMYNYAVMLDAAGRHQESLVWYEKAMKVGGPDWYAESWRAAQRRAEAKEALR